MEVTVNINLAKVMGANTALVKALLDKGIQDKYQIAWMLGLSINTVRTCIKKIKLIKDGC